MCANFTFYSIKKISVLIFFFFWQVSLKWFFYQAKLVLQEDGPTLPAAFHIPPRPLRKEIHKTLTWRTRLFKTVGNHSMVNIQIHLPAEQWLSILSCVLQSPRKLLKIPVTKLHSTPTESKSQDGEGDCCVWLVLLAALGDFNGQRGWEPLLRRD